ncbi:MAG: thiamine pyrophosphate-binding protein, partial [Firmicutes bacterium]|nr:thiamine pyrophosphate-binding protein [Bacillota bacterium]
ANAVNGIAYAFLEGSPLVVITNRLADGLHERVETQRLDHGRLLAPVCKWSAVIRPENAGETALKALRIAAEERPGPVHLDVADDVGRRTASGDPLPPGREDPVVLPLYTFGNGCGPPGRGYGPGTSPPGTEKILSFMIRDLIARSERPVLIAGHGALRAGVGGSLAGLAEAWGAPVFTTMKAKGLMPEDHPLDAGVFLGSNLARDLLARAGLVATIGVDRGELSAGWVDFHVPVIDVRAVRAEVISWRTDYQVIADPAEASRALCAAGPAGSWEQEEVQAWRRRVDAELAGGELCGETVAGEAVYQEGNPGEPRASRETGEQGRLTMTALVASARRMFPADGIVSCDVGVHCGLAAYLWPPRAGGSFFITRGLTTMGFSLPAAIGAQLACPGRRVLCLTGDGSFLMRLGELETAVRLGLPIVIMVFSDRALGVIRRQQEQRGYLRRGVDFSPTDFAAVAAGFGAAGLKAGTRAELEAALEEAFRASDRPAVIQVEVDQDDVSRLGGILRG